MVGTNLWPCRRTIHVLPLLSLIPEASSMCRQALAQQQVSPCPPVSSSLSFPLLAVSPGQPTAGRWSGGDIFWCSSLLSSGLSLHSVPADEAPAAWLHILLTVALWCGPAGDGEPFCWAGNPLLPSSFPKREPSTEGKGIFSALAPPRCVLRIGLRRGTDSKWSIALALKGSLFLFVCLVLESLQNCSVKRTR